MDRQGVSHMILVPLLAMAAIFGQTVLLARSEGRPSARQIRRLALPLLVLAAIAVFCALGLYQGGILELLALVVLDAAALVSARSALRGDRARSAFDAWCERRGRTQARANATFSAAALLACTVLGFLAIETTYNYEVLFMAPQFALLQAGIILLALSALFFLFQRRGAALTLGVALCFVIGLAQYFVASFNKAAAILPNDLFVLGTAAAVSGSYTYAIGGGVAISLSCLLLASAVANLVVPTTEPGRAPRRIAMNLGASAALLAVLAGVVTVPSYFDDLG